MAASAAMGANVQKKTSLDQAFCGSNEGETEHQSSMMMNLLLLAKNRADVYVVTAKSKRSVMVVQYSSSPPLTEICPHVGTFIHVRWRRPLPRHREGLSLFLSPHRLV